MNGADAGECLASILEFFQRASRSRAGLKGDFLWVAASYHEYTETKSPANNTARKAADSAALKRLLEKPTFAILSGAEMFRKNCLLPLHEFARVGDAAAPCKTMAAYFSQLEVWDALLTKRMSTWLRTAVVLCNNDRASFISCCRRSRGAGRRCSHPGIVTGKEQQETEEVRLAHRPSCQCTKS